MPEQNPASQLCQALQALGVTTVFGVPGTKNVAFFEALRRSPLKTVLATSELGAAFMANGHYRSTGKPGVFTTIPGPGFTQALTGLAEARHDSAAVLMIMFSPETEEVRPFALQALDHASMAGPVLKDWVRVERAADLPEAIADAWSVALAGEPGPVLIEVSVPTPTGPGTGAGQRGSVSAPSGKPHPDLLESAREMIAGAERILLFVGQGAADAGPEVCRLLEEINACVVASSSGRGVVPENQSRSVCGDFSGWGVGLVNELAATADLILILGSKLSHNGSGGFQLSLPEEKLIHVDTSEQTLEANYPARIAIRADVSDFLRAMTPTVAGKGRRRSGWTPDELSGWKARFSQARIESARECPEPDEGGPDGLRHFFDRLRGTLPDDVVLVTDSGIHQVAARRFFEVRHPRSLILPSDFQSMGFGIPAAIGAAFAAPSRKVVAIVGDGGMAMSGMELTTAVREGLDLTVIVFDDGHLGQIRLQQLRDYGRASGTELGRIDFRLLAEAVGASYLALDGSDWSLLPDALACPGVTLVDLLLSDSSRVRKLRVSSLLRAEARKVLPASIKGLVRKVLSK